MFETVLGYYIYVLKDQLVAIANIPCVVSQNMETNVKRYYTYCLNILRIDDYRKNI
jgi:hypothetical protein